MGNTVVSASYGITFCPGGIPVIPKQFCCTQWRFGPSEITPEGSCFGVPGGRGASTIGAGCKQQIIQCLRSSSSELCARVKGKRAFLYNKFCKFLTEESLLLFTTANE